MTGAKTNQDKTNVLKHQIKLRNEHENKAR